MVRLPWTIHLCQRSPRPPPRGTVAVWAGMLVLYLVWGSTYLGIAVAVETIPPFLMAAVRFSPGRPDPAHLVDRPRGPVVRPADPARMA